MIAHYVDDLIIGTTDVALRDRFIAHLNTKWKVTFEGMLDRFLGVNFARDDDGWGWQAGMQSYIDRLADRFDLTDARGDDTPMEAGFVVREEDFVAEPTQQMITEYRSLIGSIGYAATAVRFDIAFPVSTLSRHLARPCPKVIGAAKRVVRYLVRHRDFTIHWRSSPADIEAGYANTLFGCVDASFAMCNLTRKSHAGYINFVNSGAVSWKSGLQPIVTLSSCEAEYVALCTEVCEVRYLRQLLHDLGHTQTQATLIQEDNKAAIMIAENEVSSAGRCKHMELRFRFVYEAIQDGIVRVRYVQSDNNIADIMTKALVIVKFRRMIELALANKYAHLHPSGVRVHIVGTTDETSVVESEDGEDPLQGDPHEMELESSSLLRCVLL